MDSEDPPGKHAAPDAGRDLAGAGSCPGSHFSPVTHPDTNRFYRKSRRAAQLCFPCVHSHTHKNLGRTGNPISESHPSPSSQDEIPAPLPPRARPCRPCTESKRLLQAKPHLKGEGLPLLKESETSRWQLGLQKKSWTRDFTSGGKAAPIPEILQVYAKCDSIYVPVTVTWNDKLRL